MRSGRSASMLGIIDDGDITQAVHLARLSSSSLVSLLAYLVEPVARLNMVKKSKRAKRGAPARKKKGMRGTKKKRKPVPKPAPVPTAPPVERLP
jgi:hypothetical protein